VGSSRGGITGTILPEAVRLMAGFAGADVACTAAGAVAGDEGQNT